MNKKVALILSGCGHVDGTEITEATSMLIALSKYGFTVDIFAPERKQADVINHLNGETCDESRDIFIESARIARGKIQPINSLKTDQYQAIALPGGFGTVKNFTDFLHKGENASLQNDIKQVILDAMDKKLWIVAVCAAPLVVALAARDAKLNNATITFGHEKGASDFLPALNKWQINHCETELNEFHIDQTNRLITSGAYMFPNASPYEIYTCVDASIKKLSEELSKQ